MTSKDDDTLPLPGFSQELSIDTTIDEDFIPTSQPHSAGSSRMSRSSETAHSKSTEEPKSSDPVSESRIDDTLPPEAVLNQSALDKDKSVDFIPDTETKKPSASHGNGEPSCKKKLPIFGTEDIFKAEPNPLWDEIPESSGLDTQNISILNDTPTRILPSNEENVEKCEESITEIVVNDSAETVVLEATPVKGKTPKEEKMAEKLEVSDCSNVSNGERCEETQIFDNSSILLLDQPPADQLLADPESAGGVGEVTSEKLYRQDGKDSHSKGKTNGFDSKCSPLLEVAGASGKYETAEKVAEARPQVFSKQEAQSSSSFAEPDNASVVTRKIEFKLTVSCFVTLNTKTNKVLQKIILDVNETPKPKPVYMEPPSDTSEKSKRQSTSSSGSVYSDKMGPFALPQRVSTISYHTDSSEEEFGMIPKQARRALDRVPWTNEYLLPLKMDDTLMASIESQEFLKRPNVASPPKTFRSHLRNRVSHLKDILESSSSEHTAVSNSGSQESHSARTSPRGKETAESSGSILQGDKQEEEAEGSAGREKGDEKSSATVRETDETEDPNKPEADSTREEEESSSGVELRDGLAVFARWTDKRYYSGALCGTLKNDRWDVKFDDGTLKAVREDFLMPAKWLQVGSLVFASTDDKYESGQITDVLRGAETNYIVELDAEKTKISVKLSDLCLTDVMASIIREKYKPLGGTPRGKADIDCGNVLSGKRLREQRTPLRSTVAVPTGSSDAKKKSSSKSKQESLPSIKENPRGEIGGKVVGLTSENGHLVEDKVISADSPSGTEAETPLRRAAREARQKAKPRSLSYEAEETGSGKKKAKSWLAPDGTPIPGPSGVTFKQHKNKAKETPVSKPSGKSPGRTQSTGKARRKRKLDESVEDGAKKKSLKEENSRMKTRSMRG